MSPRHAAPPLGWCLVALALGAPGAGAQSVEGRVVDDARESPVAGALLRLLDRDGDERARAESDAAGRFRLAPPRPGEYYLEATRLGYRRALTPLLAFSSVEGSVPLEILMSPAPIGLEGFEVEVDVETRAAADLSLAGVEPRELGNRWIDRREIEAVPIRNDLGSVLERQNIANIRIIRRENLVPGSEPLGLCVALTRARTGSGMGTCALVVLNGLPITGEQAMAVDPDAVEAMAVLLPPEATTLYGTRGGRGALVIWLRSGGGR